MTRQSLETACHVNDAFRFVVRLVEIAKIRRFLQRLVERDLELIRHEFGNIGNIGVRHIERTTDIADRAFCRHRTERHDLRDVIIAVPFFDVFDDLTAADVAEVNVNIRHRHAFRIEETLKEKIVF